MFLVISENVSNWQAKVIHSLFSSPFPLQVFEVYFWTFCCFLCLSVQIIYVCGQSERYRSWRAEREFQWPKSLFIHGTDIYWTPTLWQVQCTRDIEINKTQSLASKTHSQVQATRGSIHYCGPVWQRLWWKILPGYYGIMVNGHLNA